MSKLSQTAFLETVVMSLPHGRAFPPSARWDAYRSAAVAMALGYPMSSWLKNTTDANRQQVARDHAEHAGFVQSFLEIDEEINELADYVAKHPGASPAPPDEGDELGKLKAKIEALKVAIFQARQKADAEVELAHLQAEYKRVEAELSNYVARQKEIAKDGQN